MRDNNDGIRIGGLGDPVAQNIRAEQNRDAAPSPEEARAGHRRYLADQGCELCDEDDPDKLTMVLTFVPDCRVAQHPRGSAPERVVCDEHKRPPRERWRDGVLTGLSNDETRKAVVFYECDNYEYASRPALPDDKKGPGIESWDDINPRARPDATADIQCPCGAQIAELVYAEDLEDDDE